MRHGAWLAFLSLVLAGSNAGGSGASSVGATERRRSAMQTGQWEFVLTPAKSVHPVYVEANLTASDAQISSMELNTALLESRRPVDSGSSCYGWATRNQLTSSKFSGKLFSPSSTPPLNEATYRATLTPDGQALYGGSYSGPVNGFCAFTSHGNKGSFTGYTVAPLNGTFSGTLRGRSSGPDEITLHFTQDSNFGVTASGTSQHAGVLTDLSISPAGSPSDFTNGYSNVIGAMVSAQGIAVRVNGTGSMVLFGHFDRKATRLQVQYNGPYGEETGILRKLPIREVRPPETRER